MLLVDLVLVLSGLLLSALLMWRYPVAVAVTFMAVGALSEATGIGVSGLQFGIGIYYMDIACVALVVCCVVVSLRARSLPRDYCWPALILLGVVLLNFGRGARMFGLKAAGNDAREIIYLIVPLATFSLLGGVVRIDVERIVAFLTLASLVLAVVAAARWTGVLALPEEYTNDDFREVIRVLSSDYAIIIGQALIGVLGIQSIQGFRTTGLIIAGIFAGLVLALQHRSVWTATLAGLAWLALRSPRLGRREWLKFSSVILLVASAFSFAPLLASGPFEKALKLVHSNVEEIRQDGSTWAWRVDGYFEATQRVFSSGLAEAALGPPSGRDLSGTASFASIHIHDRYVHTLANYGVIGLMLLLLCLLSTAARIRSSALIAPPHIRARTGNTILEALLVSAVVYFVPYTGGELEGALLGSIWLASSARRAGKRIAFGSTARAITVLQCS